MLTILALAAALTVAPAPTGPAQLPDCADIDTTVACASWDDGDIITISPAPGLGQRRPAHCVASWDGATWRLVSPCRGLTYGTPSEF